jgi:hypothetical protein
MRSCVVYVVGVTTNPVKIGIAANAQARLHSLQVGCPDELQLHYTVRCPAGLAKNIEAAIHAELAAHHRRGEWFNIEALEALAVVRRVAAEFLEQNRELADAKGDTLDRIEARYPLDSGARNAVCFYRKQTGKKSGQQFVARAQAAILRQCGQVVLNVFRLYIEDDAVLSPVRMTDPKVRARGEEALASALNVLADYYALCNEQRMLARLPKAA